MATNFIAPTGNDTTGDGSQGNPWLTIQKFINSLPAAGSVLYVRGGTYNTPPAASAGVNGGLPPLVGAAGNPITIRAYPGETPLFTGDNAGSAFLYITGLSTYVIVDGLQFANRTIAFDGMVQIGDLSYNVSNPGYNTRFITFRNCRFTFKAGLTANEHGLYVNHGTEETVIEDCTFIGAGAGNGGGWGIHVYSGSGSLPRGVTIQRCIFDGWAQGGIILAAPSINGAVLHNTFLNGVGVDLRLDDHAAIVVRDNAFSRAVGSSLSDGVPGSTQLSNHAYSQAFDASYFLTAGQTGRGAASDGTDCGARNTTRRGQSRRLLLRVA